MKWEYSVSLAVAALDVVMGMNAVLIRIKVTVSIRSAILNVLIVCCFKKYDKIQVSAQSV